jgi:hypothetical protein
MKMKKFLYFAALSMILATPSLAANAYHGAQQVDKIRNIIWCDGAFFTLQGVTVAQPTIPTGGPYFGINRAKYGANDMIATLMTAKATGRTVNVMTSDINWCGQSEVQYIELN